jgi:hypothetical protein
MIGRAIALAAALTLMAAAAHAAGSRATIRMHCASEDGFTVADWKIRAGHYRVRLHGGEWSTVPTDQVGPMLIMMQFTGAPCAVVKRLPK